jgi:hypothetical protein
VAGLSVVRDSDGERGATIGSTDDEVWEYPGPEGVVKDVGDNSLADAASNALDDGSAGNLELVQEQTALVPACKVKFQGMSYNDLDDVPSLKEEVAYFLTGRVIGHEEKISAQGDLREEAKVKVNQVKKVTPEQAERILAILGE